MSRTYPGVGPVEIGSAEIALGSCEMTLDHLDAAELLLLSGYRRVAEAVRDKRKLYERQGNADGAAIWRQATAP